MPTRRFDGVDDEIRCAIGACDRNAGATTLGFLFKKNVNAAWQGVMGVHNALGTAVQAIEIDTSNQVYWDLDVAGQSIDGTVTVANGWVMVLFGKAAGTATARCSRLVMSTGVWTHTNAGTTMVDGNSPGAAGTVRFGEWEDGDDFNGWLACAAVWNSNLSDAAREALAPGLQAWVNSAPVGLWRFDQAATTDPVNDLTGNGADQTAITGTSVDAAEVPPNFSFSLGITQAIGQATEADVSAILGAAKTREASQAVETDSAAALAASKTAAVGQAASTDAASTLTASKAAAIAGAIEADAAAALVAEKAQQLGTATEADLAQVLGAPSGQAIGAAAEVDQALALGAAKTSSLSAAGESDQAQGLLVLTSLSIGQALEAEEARALGLLRSLALAAAQESSGAQALVAAKVAAIGGASEQDIAQGFFFGSVAGLASVAHVLAAAAALSVERRYEAEADHELVMAATAEHEVGG